MRYHFDSIDKKILKLLVKDARMKVVDIASYLNLTSAAIHQRLSKVKKSGVIKEFTLRLDESKLGYTTCAFIGVFLNNTNHYERVVDQLRQIREIVEVHYTTGQYGLFLKLHVNDNDHLMKVLNGEIQKIKEVVRTETFISLDAPIERSISF